MSAEESRTVLVQEESGDARPLIDRSGFDCRSGIYSSVHQLPDHLKVPTDPDLDIASFVLSQFPNPCVAELKPAFIDSATNQKLTYAQLHRSIQSLAVGLYRLGVRKGDVVFLLSPNSLLYPTICMSIFSIGAVLSPANPINTPLEIGKQVLDCDAKLVISAPKELHKFKRIQVPTIVTSRPSKNNDLISIEELIECGDGDEVPEIKIKQSDTAAILYSSGTTGTSKGVVLTHSNLIATARLVRWYAEGTSSLNDIFLGFIPIFHIYGLGFFGFGLLCCGTTTVLMQIYDFQEMVKAIEVHKVNNIVAVPPVVLGLVKNCKGNSRLSTVRRIGSGAAPLSKEVIEAFRSQFPWVELRQGYGLTESCGAATAFVLDGAEAHPGSCGALFPTLSAKVVDIETGLALAPCKEGELWLKGPPIMKGYFRNEEATNATLDKDGWLKTGDLGYFDENGFLYIVDRIKELIKHNGYQVAPAELEAVLLSHPNILDAAVIPVEDEDSGQIPMAYVVKVSSSQLTEEQVIQFVAAQVAPYKKVRRVEFIDAIPKSAAGKILRKQLISQTQRTIRSKL
ncbi:putative Filamin-A-interacting protein [Hibiscus syriacus]|uniref:Filamin-A-interacting protein n=1 Tax=Hibiscus syriacus TaxID=106335 RepID=A0A6A2Y962_HIBSY|nr:4-coumarate--CoA ligase-like 5 [Hibiscus syriacus]KAE8670439.1 putative Filamin-A-interacting protein [Hibiscus syriacus]